MALGDGQALGRIRSFLTEPTFANVSGMTPDDVDRRRALAQALWSEGNSSRPVVGVLDGMNRMLQSYLGGKGMWRAENTGIAVRERERTAAEAEAARVEQQRVAGLNAMIEFGWPGQTGGAAAAGPVMTPGTPGFDGGAAMRQGRIDADNGTAPAAATGTRSVPQSQQEFIDAMMPFAIRESERTGIDPRIIIAQAAQETGWGRSAPNNNFFGIKSHGAPGGGSFATTEYVDGRPVTITDSFRGYNSMDDSARGYGDFMLENGRYEPMRTAEGLDAQLAALGASGYATDPNYAASVGSIARGIDLPTADAAPDPTRQFLRELAANPQMQPYIVPIIQAQIERLTTPPAPVDPVTVAQGTDLVDPTTGRVIYANDAAPETGAPDTQVLQGPDGKPHRYAWNPQTQQYDRDMGISAGGPNYFENTWDRLTAEQQVGISNDIIGAEQTALNQLQNFDAMEQLAASPSFYSGGGNQLVQGARRLGVMLGITDADAVQSIEAFSGLAAQAALDAMGGSLGAGFSNADRDFIERTMPNLGFTESGNRTLIAIHRAIANRRIEIARMLREAGGRPTPEFMQTLTQWSLANPLFTGTPGGTAATPAATASPTPAPPPAAGGLLYQNPEAGIFIQRVP